MCLTPRTFPWACYCAKFGGSASLLPRVKLLMEQKNSLFGEPFPGELDSQNVVISKLSVCELNVKFHLNIFFILITFRVISRINL